MPHLLPARLARRLLVVGLLAALLVPLLPRTTVSAATDTDFRFEGRGWGHGVGMSQHGAQGMALEGIGYQGILTHYYRDTAVRERPVDGPVVVGLDQRVRRQTIVARGGTMKVTFAGQTWTASEDSWVTLVAFEDGEQDRCRLVGVPTGDDTSDQSTSPEGPCRLTATRGTASYLELNNRDSDDENDPGYMRGRIEIHPTQWQQDGEAVHGFHITLPLATMQVYMYGLAEVPYGWEQSALRAQVVAARSYATHTLLGLDDLRADCMCHLYDDVRSQVYEGLRETAALWSRWKAAVDFTRDQVVIYGPGGPGTEDGVVKAFYSSSSGGRTESVEDYFGNPWDEDFFVGSARPYLRSVDDPRSLRAANTYASWSETLSESTVRSRLASNNGRTVTDTRFDSVASLKILERNESGSVRWLEIKGTRDGAAKAIRLPGPLMRSFLGLNSAHVDRIFLPPFVDDDGSPFEADIAWVADQGITQGCNEAGDRFCPTTNVTRGQMAAFLVEALDLTETSGKEFDDVPEDSVFAEAIDKIATAGITEGCREGSFCPNRKVTRMEMAVFLAEGLELTETSGQRYTDVQSGSPFEVPIDKIATAGITEGCDTTGPKFCPTDPVPRGQMAAFLARALRDG